MRRLLYRVLVAGAVVTMALGGLRAAGESWDGFPALENGDTNGDGAMDLSDAVYLLSWLYVGGPGLAPLACESGFAPVENGDTNGDGAVDLSDGVYLLGHLFSGGPQPVPGCGLGNGGGAGRNLNPGVLPPHASAYGKSLAEWTAVWWQWAIALPIDNHPLFDTAPCGTGQSGKVFFLGGAFTGTATTRDCTVPLGKAILLPIINVECSTVEPPPFHGDNEAELRACAKAFLDSGTAVSANIDGREVQNLNSYRVQSPLFDFSAPDNNSLFIPGPVSGLSLSDGVWLLLAPLSAGRHAIHFVGFFPGFPLDITYNLTVR